jgi:hypothetical protein
MASDVETMPPMAVGGNNGLERDSCDERSDGEDSKDYRDGEEQPAQLASAEQLGCVPMLEPILFDHGQMG